MTTLVLTPLPVQAVSDFHNSSEIQFQDDAQCGDTSSATTAPNATRAQPPTYILGDSILVESYYDLKDLQKAMNNAGLQPKADASGGRGMEYAGSDPRGPLPGKTKSGLDAITADAATIRSAKTVVIELGTNESNTDVTAAQSANIFKSQMEKAISKIKNINGSAQIYWVNIFSNVTHPYTPYVKEYNQVISSVAAAKKINVIDTTKAGITLNSDGIHPDAAGSKKFAKTVVDALTGGGVSPSDSAPSGADNAAASPPNSESVTEEKTVVIDPGHGPTKVTTDDKTGLTMSESDNQPEGHDVWEVAQKIKNDLSQEGYKIILTKKSEDENVTFRQRAEIADNSHAALALSIHGDPGLPDPGQIFVQKVGLYRGSGENKTTFEDEEVAQKSQQYAQIFKEEREKAEKDGKVVIKDNSFDGRPGLEPGDIPLVQLFSKTPWVYNEKKMSFDKNKYAKGLENAIKKALGPSSSEPGSGADACCETSGTTTLSGKDNIEKTINFFMSQENGLSLAQAIGVAANLAWESGGGVNIDPLVSGPTPEGQSVWGVAQWTGANVQVYIGDKDKNNITGSDGELATQLEVLWAQMQGKGEYNGGSSIVPGLQQIDNAGEAADYFRENFERCDTSNSSCTTDRVNTANDFFQKYNGGYSPPPSAGGDSSEGCSSVTGGQGTVEGAVEAAQKLSDYEIPYSQACRTLKKTPPSCGYDCSASVAWVLLSAGFELPNNKSWGDWAPVSGDFENWGKAGKGEEMTVWANADHVFIEFNVPGVGHHQLNTSGGPRGDGPEFFEWGANGQYDAEGSGFIPRHWPGT